MKLPFSRQQPAGGRPPEEEHEPYRQINVDEARKLLDDGKVQVIDVREPWEYNNGHLPGARLVPLNTLLRQPKQYLDKDGLVFVCASGERSAVACEMAAAMGFKEVYNVAGGTIDWIAKGYPVEK